MYLQSDEDKLVISSPTAGSIQIIVMYHDITVNKVESQPLPKYYLYENDGDEIILAGSSVANTTRQITYMSYCNLYGDQDITIKLTSDSQGTIELYNITLAVGDVLEWSRDFGWKKSPDNLITEAAGNNTEIQFNDNGQVAGDADLTWNKTTNTLGLGGADTGVELKAITNEPSAPSSGVLRVYSKYISGRMLPKWKGPSGLDTPFQPAFFGNNIVMWNPGATSGVAIGTVVTAIAAGVATLPTTTNQYTAMRRSVFTVATGANLQNSIRTEAMFFRGASGSQGGFFAFCRFGFSAWTTNNRCFVGFTVGTTAVTTVDPSSLLNIAGFGIDSADTAFTFMHNDGSGTAVKETISGQPALATNNAYDVFIFCPPSSNIIYYRMDNMLTQTTLVNTSVNTDLPVNTTMLNFHVAIGSGSNTGAGVAAIGLNRFYIETDY